MWLSDLSIRQPVFISMVLAAAVVLGGMSYSRMAVDLFPDVAFPVVAVRTTFPGAGPAEVETLVTKPLEDALGSISGVEHVRSTSSESVSLVVVEFDLGHPVEEGANAVRDRVAAVRPLLPDGADDPAVLRFDPSQMPIMSIAVSDRSGRLAAPQIRKLLEDAVEPRLERLEGVAAVTVEGGGEREIQVALSLDATRARNLSVPQIGAALRAENQSIPGGRLAERQQEYLLRTTGEFSSVAEIGSVVVGTRNGVPVFLRDIATISDGFKEQRTISRLNGQEAVALAITKQSGANTVQVAEQVTKELAAVGARYPDLDFAVVRDDSTAIKEANDDVRLALVLGALCATVVVYLFFQDWRNTLVTVAGLPIIVTSTFAVMHWLGFSLNMLSLLGLSLSIGILIDDAIVVRENIFRHTEQGEEPVVAASKGTREIAFAVLATTFSIVAVFLPVGFASGMIGQFLREFGITVAAAVLISLVEAFTLAPMLSAHFFHRTQHGRERRAGGLGARLGRAYDRVTVGYGRLLGWSLGHRRVVVGVGITSLAGSLALVSLVGVTFFPRTEERQFTMSLELPAGTTLEETDLAVRYLGEVVAAQPEVRHVYTRTGASDGAPERGSVYVRLHEHAESARVQERLREQLRHLPGLTFSSQDPMGGATTSVANRPLVLAVQGGSSLADLDAASRSILEAIREVPGLQDLDRTYKPGKPELRIVVDRQRAADLGLSAGTLGATVRTLVNGDVPSTLREGDTETDIRVRLREQDRTRLNDLLRLTVPTAQGVAVPLSAVARVEIAVGPVQIEREDRQRQVLVGAETGGRPLGDVAAEVRQRLEQVALPPGVTYAFTGNTQQSEESFGSLLQALLLGIVFLYMVLASQFGSFLHPFTIMLSLPLSLAGAFLGLLVFGKPLDIMGMIGIIMLMGLVTKNAILLIDFILRLRRDGYDRRTAIMTAGPVRLRPILMTTLAMVFGMVPTALSVGSSSGFRAPMAITVIGGLITSTLLTLVVVPVVYTLLDDVQGWRPRRHSRTAGPEWSAFAGEEMVGARRDG
ncbi:MAG: efflux RND transporter permease subunit [Chloroflexi bacterium]|nr:efflux RND transporter permease subunit [Chloroflexota bacterium]